MSKLWTFLLILVGGIVHLPADEALQGDIRAVIFDCDGTLVDSEHAHFTSWQYALQYHGGELSLEEYYGYIGKPVSVIAEILAKKVGKDCAAEILSGKRTHYYSLIKEGHPPIQHTMDFLHHLAKEKDRLGLKLGLASAAPKRNILLNLRHHGIEHLFDVILSGQDDLTDYVDAEGVNKPKPYIYLLAAKMLNLAPAECVVIEDSHGGVTAGKSAGCVTIAVPNEFTQYQDLSHAHLVVDSFSPMTVQEFLETVKQLKLEML
jgi:beta-phosphoglucomutase